MAADGVCEMNVVHRINEGYRACGALKVCWEIEDWGVIEGIEVIEGVIEIIILLIWRSNCTNGVVWSRSMGYEKC